VSSATRKAVETDTVRKNSTVLTVPIVSRGAVPRPIRPGRHHRPPAPAPDRVGEAAEGAEGSTMPGSGSTGLGGQKNARARM
jgi:hypothetical protein